MQEGKSIQKSNVCTFSAIPSLTHKIHLIHNLEHQSTPIARGFFHESHLQPDIPPLENWQEESNVELIDEQLVNKTRLRATIGHPQGSGKTLTHLSDPKNGAVSSPQQKKQVLEFSHPHSRRNKRSSLMKNSFSKQLSETKYSQSRSPCKNGRDGGEDLMKKMQNMTLFFMEEETQIAKNESPIKQPSQSGQEVEEKEEQNLRGSSNYLKAGPVVKEAEFFVSIQSPKSQPSIVKRVAQSRCEFIKVRSLNSLKQKLSRNMQEGTALKLALHVNNGGFNVFWPQYSLRFENSELLMAAKRTSYSPASTYHISTKCSDFQENSEYYLGKVKSDARGNIFNVFGPGLSPSDAKSSHQIPRQLLATIVYEQLVPSMPREFKVYIKKEEYHYYINFPQMKMYSPEIPLHQLYTHAENREKIDFYRSRQASYNFEKKIYTLNLHGEATCPSSKNFILYKPANEEELIFFGKSTSAKFNTQIFSPLSPLLGFAVALTSF